LNFGSGYKKELPTVKESIEYVNPDTMQNARIDTGLHDPRRWNKKKKAKNALRRSKEAQQEGEEPLSEVAEGDTSNQTQLMNFEAKDEPANQQLRFGRDSLENP